MAPIKLALLGLGHFARDAYLPILKGCADAEVAAVWSRSEETVQSVLPAVQEFSPNVKAYYGEEGLSELLAQPEIEAVLLVVPPQGITEAIKKCLAAGKHVLSEKPVAPRLFEAQELIHWHGMLPDAPLWCVQENFRSEKVFLRARELLAGVGPVFRLDLSAHYPLSPASKYWTSGWRRDAQGCPGCFFMDSSVHFIAALRLLAQGAGWGEAVSVSATASNSCPGLPSPDTGVGVVRFENGQAATVSISFGTSIPRFTLLATGAQGAVEARRGGWGCEPGRCLLTHQRTGEKGLTTETLPYSGLEGAIEAFLALVQREKPREQAGAGAAAAAAEPAPAAPAKPAAEPAVAQGQQAAAVPELTLKERVSPVEAAKDLAIIEALLKSSAQGGQVVKVADVGNILSCGGW